MLVMAGHRGPQMAGLHSFPFQDSCLEVQRKRGRLSLEVSSGMFKSVFNNHDGGFLDSWRKAKPCGQGGGVQRSCSHHGLPSICSHWQKGGQVQSLKERAARAGHPPGTLFSLILTVPPTCWVGVAVPFYRQTRGSGVTCQGYKTTRWQGWARVQLCLTPRPCCALMWPCPYPGHTNGHQMPAQPKTWHISQDHELWIREGSSFLP